MDRSSKQKINKETQALNDTIVQRDLIDIYRTFHPKDPNKYPSTKNTITELKNSVESFNNRHDHREDRISELEEIGRAHV